MPSLEAHPVFWMTKIIACAVLLQGLELFQIRRSFEADGIWRWETLRKEFLIFPRAFQWLLDALLDYPRFIIVICGQIGLALALLALPEAHPAVFIGLLLTTGLIALRWRGTFNGGADYMTVLVLMILSVDAVFQGQPIIRLGCLWYLGLQTVFSYFIAGVVKLRNGDWRTGRALQRFLSSPPYDPPDFVVRLSGHSGLMRLGSWAILVFEVSFPIALLSPMVCSGVLGAAFVFHVANFAVFGLNRFIFAWCAAYPALYFCSTQRLFG